MEQLRNLVVVVIATSILAGCAWTGAKRVESRQELTQLVAAGPLIEPIEGEAPSRAVRSPEQVDLHYYMFKPLGKPDAWIDWEYHYVIAPASHPDYRFRRFAKVTVFREDRDDVAALGQMRVAAASVGADAVVDLVRVPQIGPVAGAQAEIYGYSYTGTAVVRDVP